MIDNFEEIKRQLAELSEVINKFKSEAVQLRIVEIVLGDAELPGKVLDTEDDTEKIQRTTRRKKASRTKNKPKTEGDAADTKLSKKTRGSGQGAVAVLSDLVEKGFFKNPRKINDIVSHCEEKLAHRFKSNEFSGKLARLTREGVLERSKNSEGQYEYTEA